MTNTEQKKPSAEKMLTSLKSETGHFQAQPVYVEARDTMDKHKPKRDFSGNLESDKMKNHLALKELKPPSSNGCYRGKKKIKISGC